MRCESRCWLLWVLVLATVLAGRPAVVAADPSVQLSRPDPIAEAGVAAWRAFLSQLTVVDDVHAARRINDFVNRRAAATDTQLWGSDDYWATPTQFFTRGAGDCEDFALAKFHSLKLIGVPDRRLWLGYARVKRPGQLRIEAHMVLLFEDRGGQRWVLDNLHPTLTMLGQRTDIAIRTSINSFGIWQLPARGEALQLAGPKELPPTAFALLAAASGHPPTSGRRVVSQATDRFDVAGGLY